MTADVQDKILIRRAAVFTAVYNGLFLIFLLAKPGSQAFFTAADDWLQVLGGVFAAGLCYLGAKPSLDAIVNRKPVQRHHWMALFCCLSMLSYALGQLFWTYDDLIRHNTSLIPDNDDYAYLLSYPLLLLGILLFPARPLPAASRARIFLDGLVIMTGAVTFSWYFLLGPTLLQTQQTLGAKIVTTAYPLGDLVMTLCLLLLGSRPGDEMQRKLVRVMSLGLLINVAVDSYNGYVTLHGQQVSGTWLDACYSIGYMPFAIAVAQARLFAERHAKASAGKPSEAEQSADTTKVEPSLWKALMPYALLPCVGILVLYSRFDRSGDAYDKGVYIGAGILTALVLARQILAIIENRQLNEELQGTQEDLKANLSALKAANERLQSLATTDLLTDLPNHRGLVAALDGELERSFRYKRHCAVLFFDIDHFKALNDTCGHPAGDAALREFATLIRGRLRSVDVLGRWGGEEFLALLPETSADEAKTVAEHVRNAVANYSFATAGGSQLTCSVGIAAYPRDATDRDSIVNCADQAMYVAKRLGRNQVRLAHDPAVLAMTGTNVGRSTRDQAALIGIVEALTALIERRDGPTGEHTHDVEALANRIALKLGMSEDEARMIGLGGRLHDIGKVAVPDYVLHKKGKLDGDEWDIMRTHTTIAADVIGRVPTLRALVPVVRSHHERWDGTGYPDGLRAEGIPLGARIIAVADAYCAMTTDRPYQAARDHNTAIEELQRCAGSQFDATIVEIVTELAEEDKAVAETDSALSKAA